MRKKKNNKWTSRLSQLVALALLVVVLAWFSSALDGLAEDRHEEGKRQLEDALRRSAVACYAAEGIYPPDLSYLAEHYGVQIDEEQYFVHYGPIADNLMPEIAVMSR